jgi:hypothetical protein
MKLTTLYIKLPDFRWVSAARTKSQEVGPYKSIVLFLDACSAAVLVLFELQSRCMVNYNVRIKSTYNS